MRLIKIYKTLKIIGLLSLIVVTVGTLLILAQQKQSKIGNNSNKSMQPLEDTELFYRTSTTEVDTDEGNKITAVRRINMIVDDTDSEGNLIKRQIPMIEIELYSKVAPPVSNLINIVRVGDKDMFPSNRACGVNPNCVSVELYPKEFEELPDNALITYRIGYPVSPKNLKELYKDGEPKEVVGVKFGRLDKSRIDKFPTVERSAVQN